MTTKHKEPRTLLTAAEMETIFPPEIIKVMEYKYKENSWRFDNYGYTKGDAIQEFAQAALKFLKEYPPQTHTPAYFARVCESVVGQVRGETVGNIKKFDLDERGNKINIVRSKVKATVNSQTAREDEDGETTTDIDNFIDTNALTGEQLLMMKDELEYCDDDIDEDVIERADDLENIRADELTYDEMIVRIRIGNFLGLWRGCISNGVVA